MKQMAQKFMRGRVLASAALAAAVVLFLAACAPSVDSGGEIPPSPVGKGRVTIQLGIDDPSGVSSASAGRTLLPAAPQGFSSYDLKFTPKGGEGTLKEETGVSTLNGIELDAGTYTLELSAYKNSEKAAEGTVEVVITEGQDTDVTVPLTFLQSTGEGNGTLTVTVTDTSGFVLSGAEFTWVPLNGGTVEGNEALSDPGLSGTKELAEGYYVITVTLSAEERAAAKRSDVVYIGLEQTTPLEWAFDESRFSTTVEEIWLLGNGDQWETYANANKLAQTGNGTFVWEGDMTQSDFRFSLEDTSNTGWNGTDKTKPDRFQPETDGAIGFDEAVSMTFAAKDSGEATKWSLSETGYYQFVVNPLAKQVTVYQLPVVAETGGSPDITLDGQTPTQLVITWNKALDNASGYAGFTLSGASSPIGFTASSVTDAVQTLTMSRAIVKSEIAGLTLAYNPTNSSPVKDTVGSTARAFTAKAVTVTNEDDFGTPPALSSAAIAAASPTNLVLTFDQAVQATSAAGFSVSGSATATTIVTAVTGAGTDTLTLSLNRKPAYGEVLKLAYNAGTGNVAHNTDPTLRLASFSDSEVTLNSFTEQNDSRPEIQTVGIDAENETVADKAKVIKITFDKAVTVTNAVGFTVANSVTAETVTGIAGTGTTTLQLTLNDWPSLSEGSNSPAFTLSYNMDLGNARDGSNNLVLSFSRAVTLTNFDSLPNSGENTDTTPPRMVSATVEDGNANIVRVVFNEPVTIDKDKFYVKVNDLPYKTMAAAPPASGILLDLQKRDDRTITGVSAVPGMNDTAWDMTMTAPAVHGEILRLATTEEGAAQDKAPSPNSLPTIPQFIVSNNVKRVKGSFESIAGLYVNETKIDSVTDGGGGLMYQNALDYLHSTATLPKGNDTIVIVLDTNQTFTRTAAWWTYNQIAENTSNQQPIKIIVTTTGGSVIISNQQSDRAMFEGRNGIILVIDEGVIFEGSSSYPTKGSLIQMMTGGSIILDGGEIRGHVSAKDGGTGSEQNDIHAGAIRFGGGANGGYLIINSGKITGNTAKFNTSSGPGSLANGAAGAVIVLQYGVMVMNGGEISGNTLDVQGASPTSALAGAVMGNINNAQRSGNLSFFMTGGEISGNKVINSVADVAGSAVVVSGTFQKNGGTIYGADAGDPNKQNTTTVTGNKASAVFVAKAAGSNPADAFKRDNTASPDVTLFVESNKPSASGLPTNTVPVWATSFWDE